MIRDFVPFLLVVVAVALFFLVSPFVDVNLQTEWLRVWQVVLFGVGFVVFVMSLRRLFSVDVPASVRRFLLGLMVFCMGAADGAGWRLLWRLSGRGDDVEWMLTNRFPALLLWLEVIGLALMISGPASSDDRGRERIGWVRIGITGLLCVVIGYLVVIGRPDARSVVDYLRPLLETRHGHVSPSMG